MSIYDNIRNLRIKNGWSQEELAQKTGYTSRAAISRIEKGETDLSRSKIILFARVFGVSVVELMDIKDEQLFDPAEQIAKIFRKLTAQQQEIVFTMCETMLAQNEKKSAGSSDQTA